MTKQKPEFIANKATRNRGDQFIDITVDTAAVIKSWRLSMFSHEWLDSEDSIKPLDALPEREQSKRKAVEQSFRSGTPLEKPVLGIGIADNVEIGAGRAEFLTLAAMGHAVIPVHIPKSNESDFKDFLADVDW
jgi:hypothetical protein